MEKSKLPSNYDYLDVSQENDEYIFRIKQIKDEHSALAWLAEFSDTTKSTWRLSRTYPNSGKINVFKVDLRCVHNTDRRVTGKGPSKHTGCPAKMTIVVKRVVTNSKGKNNDVMTSKYPTIISIRGKHNHALNTAATLRHRDLSDDIKLKFLKLFRQGHSVASALQCHKTDLMLEYGDNYYRIAADGKYLPSYSVVNNLFKKEFQKEYGQYSEGEMLQNLNEQLNEYTEKTGGIAEFKHTSDKNHYFVVICTPIMLRAHAKLPQTNELVMVDASGGIDKERHRIYFFVTPCAAGGIPLAIIVTDTEKEYVFLEAVQCLNECLPNTAFFSQKYPKVFMTDNDLKEHSALKTVFPQATLLLCHFHMLRAVWKWLLDANHKIPKTNRQELYFLFRKILYSKTEETAKQNLSILVECALKLNSRIFVIYITKLMKQKEMWINFYRKNLLIRGNNTTNYVEIVFRILKDCIFNRTMAFNLIQLVDYIITKYEMYLKIRLIDFCNNRYNNLFLKKMMPSSECENFVIESGEFGLFEVKNMKGDVYTVNLEQGYCSCVSGCSGKLCKHSSAVILKLDSSINTAYNVVSIRTKENLFYVAEGTSPPTNWFLPLHKDLECPKSISDTQHNITTNELNPPSTSNITDLHDEINQSSTSIINNLNMDENVEEFSVREMEHLENTFLRIKEGITKDPKNYVPAVRRFLKNVDAYAKTDCGLLSGLHTFATYSGVQSAHKAAKKIVRRCHKTRIGVQPTAIGRRKYFLTGKKKPVLVGLVALRQTILRSMTIPHLENYPPEKEKLLTIY